MAAACAACRIVESPRGLACGSGFVAGVVVEEGGAGVALVEGGVVGEAKGLLVCGGSACLLAWEAYREDIVQEGGRSSRYRNVFV